MSNYALCSRCFHSKENHKPIDAEKPIEKSDGGFISHICTGDITCSCEHFEEPILMEFAQEIEKFKHLHTKIGKRCKFILQKIPTTRNAGDKSFPKIYKEIWHGVKIRKLGTNLTYDVWKDLPSDDDINREKRRVKEHNVALQTYDKKVLFEQTALYQAMMEMSINA